MEIAMDLPAGWDGRVYRRPVSQPLEPPGGAGFRAAGLETTQSIAHAANFALPVERGDFGSGAVELMGRDHVFIALFEYGPESVGTPLFEHQSQPRSLSTSSFSPASLQRTLPDQAGSQVFFSARDRAFCLYVVLGAHDNAQRLISLVNTVIGTIQILPSSVPRR
ncbi:MAG: hypothetical protein M3378_11260 [Actinomycetota bacterium]|nr:hypothetical protein [Actinomycetota bacterium]